MSASAARGREPLLVLPGFMPDAISFSLRTTLAMLLAYLVAFALQLESASSAGVCVAIVAQPTLGMAMSKAVYRTAGTVVGGVAALVVVAAFPQDRTMLLAAFTIWLGLCAYLAALLRDFRSYGAVLCGYTVGIIAVSGIDAPDGALLATLNRVAAILLGIGAVAVVNVLFSSHSAFDELETALRERLATAEALARSALAGQGLPAEPLPAEMGAAILALRTQADYLAAEIAEAGARRAGATAAIAGLLGMLSATRAIATGLQQPAGAAIRGSLADAGSQLAGDAPRALQQTVPESPLDAALLDRMHELLAQHDIVLEGLRTLADGRGRAVHVKLPVHRDHVAAALNAARTVIAVVGGCVFCIYAGWSGATLLLVQQAAFTALLGMTPNPSAAALGMAAGLPLATLAAAVIGFVLLPLASGFVPFCLALAPFVFAAAMATRHKVLAPYSSGLLLFLVLLLSPANTEQFDLSSFLNTAMVQVVALTFMLVAFRFVLPVSPTRRLFRVTDAIVRRLRRALDGEVPHHGAISARCLRVDRLAQAQIWLGRRTPNRIALLERLSAFSELDSALRRAWAGMRALGLAMPPREPDALEAASRELLAGASPPSPAVLHAAAGLYASAVLIRSQRRALRHYGVTGA